MLFIQLNTQRPWHLTGIRMLNDGEVCRCYPLSSFYISTSKSSSFNACILSCITEVSIVYDQIVFRLFDRRTGVNGILMCKVGWYYSSVADTFCFGGWRRSFPVPVDWYIYIRLAEHCDITANSDRLRLRFSDELSRYIYITFDQLCSSLTFCRLYNLQGNPKKRHHIFSLLSKIAQFVYVISGHFGRIFFRKHLST